jgi:hypothetical protein
MYGINDANENVARKISVIKAIKITEFWKDYNLMSDAWGRFG